MCQEYEMLINKAIDHELSKEEEEKLVAHLQQCPSCKEEYEALKGLKSWLGHMEECDLPIGFHESLINRINEEETKRTNSKKVIKKEKINKHKLKTLVGIAASLFVGSTIFYQLMHFNFGSSYDAAPNCETSMARAASEMADSAACEAEEEAPEVAVDGHYKISCAPSETEDQQAEVAAAADDAKGATWYIKTADTSKMISDVTRYLDEQQIDYEVSGNKVIILTNDKQESLEKWLKDQDIEVTKSEETVQNESIVLIFEAT